MSRQHPQTLTWGRLKQILKDVPDDFEIGEADVNYGGSDRIYDDLDVEVHNDTREILFPGGTQQYLD